MAEVLFTGKEYLLQGIGESKFIGSICFSLIMFKVSDKSAQGCQMKPFDLFSARE